MTYFGLLIIGKKPPDNRASIITQSPLPCKMFPYQIPLILYTTHAIPDLSSKYLTFVKQKASARSYRETLASSISLYPRVPIYPPPKKKKIPLADNVAISEEGSPGQYSDFPGKNSPLSLSRRICPFRRKISLRCRYIYTCTMQKCMCVYGRKRERTAE